MAALTTETRPGTFENLLERACAGSEEAWDEIYNAYSASVCGYLASRGASDQDDLTAEVFLKVARNINRFRGDEAKFRSWIFVIAHRMLIDSRRMHSRRPQQTELNGDSQGGNVEEEALEQLAVEDMRGVFDNLTEDQRHVLDLRIIADLSLDQTASVLGKRVGAVKALQRRALASVKTQLERGQVSL